MCRALTQWFAAREGSALAEECAVLRDAIGRTDGAQSQLRSRREHDVEWTRVQLQGLQVRSPRAAQRGRWRYGIPCGTGIEGARHR